MTNNENQITWIAWTDINTGKKYNKIEEDPIKAEQLITAIMTAENLKILSVVTV